MPYCEDCVHWVYTENLGGICKSSGLPNTGGSSACHGFEQRSAVAFLERCVRDGFSRQAVGQLLVERTTLRAERDEALATLARLRELLSRDVLERAEVCARTMRCMTGMAMLAQTYADTAEALHAAAALLWPGEDAK